MKEIKGCLSVFNKRNEITFKREEEGSEALALLCQALSYKMNAKNFSRIKRASVKDGYFQAYGLTIIIIFEDKTANIYNKYVYNFDGDDLQRVYNA